jgi:hypothetical protein
MSGSETRPNFQFGVKHLKLVTSATPLLDKAGWVRGVVAAFLDITRLKRQEAEIAKLVSEVNHRAKNILTLVQAIARQTTATSPPHKQSRRRGSRDFSA